MRHGQRTAASPQFRYCRPCDAWHTVDNVECSALRPVRGLVARRSYWTERVTVERWWLWLVVTTAMVSSVNAVAELLP